MSILQGTFHVEDSVSVWKQKYFSFGLGYEMDEKTDHPKSHPDYNEQSFAWREEFEKKATGFKKGQVVPTRMATGFWFLATSSVGLR
jgi:hypothetical protein